MPFVAFVLVGYFGPYAWLRVTGEIVPWGEKVGPQCYIGVGIDFDGRVNGQWPWDRKILKWMWPAMRLDAALYRTGIRLPWNRPDWNGVYLWIGPVPAEDGNGVGDGSDDETEE